MGGPQPGGVVEQGRVEPGADQVVQAGRVVGRDGAPVRSGGEHGGQGGPVGLADAVDLQHLGDVPVPAAPDRGLVEQPDVDDEVDGLGDESVGEGVADADAGVSCTG